MQPGIETMSLVFTTCITPKTAETFLWKKALSYGDGVELLRNLFQ